MAQEAAPAIAALFLARFDQKIGYHLIWKRSQDDLNLDGVEYQCFASGLHDVQEDLVYFTKDAFVGISAFVQRKSDAEHRNAEFAAVGVLVAKNDEASDRSWLHAAALRELANEVAGNLDDVAAMDSFWEAHRQPRHALHSQHEVILPDDPALSMSALMATFGPLILPLHRAALLRKRILLLGSAPVQTSCNFVYNLARIGEIHDQYLDLPSSSTSPSQALYSIGVHDIPRLQAHKDGFIACTTDDIIAEKTQLYDLLIKLPQSDKSSGTVQWPRLRTSHGRDVRATQRDLRRYHAMSRGLQRLRGENSSGTRYRDDDMATQQNLDDMPLLPSSYPVDASDNDRNITSGAVEPESWSSMAYRSMVWWASGSDEDLGEVDEAEADEAMFNGLPALGLYDDNDDAQVDALHQQHTAATMLAYFERLTAHTIRTLADVVRDAADQAEGGYITVKSADLRRLGLDAWSQGDRDFVVEGSTLYFGKEVTMMDDGIMVCGIRIC